MSCTVCVMAEGLQVPACPEEIAGEVSAIEVSVFDTREPMMCSGISCAMVLSRDTQHCVAQCHPLAEALGLPKVLQVALFCSAPHASTVLPSVTH